jgi:pSer/pThr/pTyr-binding forkhead associated (FHA) protein
MVAVLHPLNDGNQIVLDRAVILVGRSPDCDAVLTGSSKISRMHCALVQVR